jgi:23S rRNA (cytidine1920-2'-O)/16S rRNA (cytidine1409-2'-O)-methyltransferase
MRHKETIDSTTIKKKIRADALLFESGLVKSRQEAQRRILAGEVWAGDKRIDKSGMRLDTATTLRLTGHSLPFVGRGGLKLQAALQAFQVDVTGRIAVDVGASTGGFTDCLLKQGIQKVYAVDVGYGQLDWKIRQNPRVVVLERTNARYLTRELLPDAPDIAVIDVSFISVKKILPGLVPLLKHSARLIILIKPQFEVGKNEVGKGGIVKDPQKHQHVIDDIVTFCRTLELKAEGCIPSPVLGAKGNREFLLLETRIWEK